MASMEPIAQVRQMLLDLVGGPNTPFMERRAQADAFARAFIVPSDIRIETGLLGGVPVEWIHCDGAVTNDVIFHVHGGGYVLGNPAGSRPLTTKIARAARCRVVSVDYRLAPEFPFPAAVEDCLMAYSALLASGQDPRSVAIGGESAGGGLAVATLVAARNARLAMPASLVAISPWTDMACDAPSFAALAGRDPLLTNHSLKEMADAYLAGADPRAPTASPALADLTGLPPMLIHVGSDEVLLDDARALHRRALAHGVDAEIEVWPRMIHVWHMFHPVLPEAGEAIAGISEFFRLRWRRAADAHENLDADKR